MERDLFKMCAYYDVQMYLLEPYYRMCILEYYSVLKHPCETVRWYIRYYINTRTRTGVGSRLC